MLPSSKMISFWSKQQMRPGCQQRLARLSRQTRQDRRPQKDIEVGVGELGSGASHSGGRRQQ